MGRIKSLEKVFVSNKYKEEIKSIKKEIDKLKQEIPINLKNMTGEKQIEIMKKLFSKKHGIMNKLAATDNSSASGFNRIAKIINDHPDNPLNIHKNNINDSISYLGRKFGERNYNKNIIQSSQLRNKNIAELKKNSEQLNLSFAQENNFSINDVIKEYDPWIRIKIFHYTQDINKKVVGHILPGYSKNNDVYYDPENHVYYRPIPVKKGQEYLDKQNKIIQTFKKIQEEYISKIIHYTNEEIKNTLRAISDYTDFIKSVKNEFQKYYNEQSTLSTKTLGGKQKRRFAEICMNLKYEPPTEQEIRAKILELKTEKLKRDKEIPKN